MRSKQLVAFTPVQLQETLNVLTERCSRTRGGLSDEAAVGALRAVKQAKALYEGLGPMYLISDEFYPEDA